MKRHLLLLFALSLVVTLQAASESKVGTAAAPFLKLAPGARYMAMGQTGTAFVDGPEAVYWNPARMAWNQTSQVSLDGSLYVAETNHGYAGFTMPLEDTIGFGGAVMLLNAGSIDQVNDAGAPVGSFSPRDMSAAGGLSFSYGRLRLGGLAKYVSSTILKRASTFTGDGGLWYLLGDKINVAVTGQNLFGKLKFVDEEADLPRLFRCGLSSRLMQPLLVSVEGLQASDSGVSYGGGLEYTIGMPNKDQTTLYFLRAGFNSVAQKDKGSFAGATFGVGLRLNRLQFDYAWVPLGDLGQTHYLSMNFEFAVDGVRRKIPKGKKIGDI